MSALMTWRGNGLMDQMRREMDDVFRRFFTVPVDTEGPDGFAAWAPRIDVEETDKALVVKADLPGVDPKDVEVSVHDNVLELKGEKREQREDKGKNYHRIERSVGRFYRAVPLPSGADAENISATGGKGVLTVTIPKKAIAQPKRVAVKAQENNAPESRRASPTRHDAL
jgi:HSP20 family protein